MFFSSIRIDFLQILYLHLNTGCRQALYRKRRKIMPRLDCSVVNCKYNQNHGCIRDNISVGGAGASSSGETCCDSFEEKRGDSMTNSFKEASEKVNIRCEAKKCVHNNDCSCRADHIDVGGSNACKCEQTVCGTFYKK